VRIFAASFYFILLEIPSSVEMSQNKGEHDVEKELSTRVQNNTVTKLPSEDSQDADFEFTPEEQRKIIRRIDYRLVTTVGAMYCISLIDRTNLSAAAIAGMKTELELSVYDRYVSLSTFLVASLSFFFFFFLLLLN
jgi:hypothetical protein